MASRTCRILASQLALSAPLLLVAGEVHAEIDGFDERAEHQSHETGIEFALMLGYSTFAGRTEQDQLLRERFVAAVPLRLDGGYRFGRLWWAGLYLEYAPLLATGWMETRCADCTHNWWHFGVGVEHDVPVDAHHLIWFGAYAGESLLSNELRREERSTRERRFTGLEGSLRSGLRIRLLDGLAVGPTFSITGGTFATVSEQCGSGEICPARTQRSTEGSSLYFSATTGLSVVFLP